MKKKILKWEDGDRTQGSEFRGRYLIHHTMKDLLVQWLKTIIYFKYIKFQSTCRKFAGHLEQNCKSKYWSACFKDHVVLLTKKSFNKTLSRLLLTYSLADTSKFVPCQLKSRSVQKSCFFSFHRIFAKISYIFPEE